MVINVNDAQDDTGNSQLRVVLQGGSARLGEVPAADVARLIDGSIRSIARAAELVSGRTPGKVGRRGIAVEKATRFVLDGIARGSVMLLLRPPAPGAGGGLELEDSNLTDLAISSTLDAIAGKASDPYLAAGLADLGEELGLGSRYQDIRFEFRDRGSTRAVALDRKSLQRLRRTASTKVQAASDAVLGTLVEADFERLSARLRTPSDRLVKVSFDARQADDIQQALRKKTELDGIVTYDPETNEALSIETRTVTRTEAVALKFADTTYWQDSSVDVLAQEQGVSARADTSGLHDDEATEAELDAFFEALNL